MLHKPVHPIVTVSVVIGVILLIGASPFITRAFSRFNFSFTPPPKITYVQVTPHPITTAAPNVPTVIFNQHTFTSTDLGISFDYVDTTSQPIHVQEAGDKVYLNARSDKPPLGKYVEVFSKNPSDSLVDAVKKQFLQGHSLQDCPIVPANLDKRTLNPTYQYIQIGLPGPYSGDIKFLSQQAKLCPPIYTYNRNTLVYFTMDTNHPGEFVFFSLGQDNIGGKPPVDDFPITWDHTIRFIGN
ncbi:MAG TPA: hypothetical protein VEL49_07540 [Ktedonobacteraceae bacterium]|nr:hypothetical protein [Ktedonobacteraceae bacterium]